MKRRDLGREVLIRPSAGPQSIKTPHVFPIGCAILRSMLMVVAYFSPVELRQTEDAGSFAGECAARQKCGQLSVDIDPRFDIV